VGSDPPQAHSPVLDRARSADLEHREYGATFSLVSGAHTDAPCAGVDLGG
jgi:hypothetical protein